MPWDGIKRRSEDSGGESPETILARIDERQKNMNDKILLFYTDFQEHKQEDDRNFKIINRLIYAGGGIFGFLSFLILMFKH